MLIDTCIWIWWAEGSGKLDTWQKTALENAILANGFAISSISCWEVALKARKGDLALSADIDSWIRTALALPGLYCINLDPNVLVESTRLPDRFHKDPADRMIAATSRIWDLPLLTTDGRILAYGDYVRLVEP